MASLTPRKPPSLPNEPSAFKEGELVDSRYRIQGFIGMGPVGELYRGFDQEMDLAVALKAISPKLLQTREERQAFSKQIRLARKFSHPNLLHVHSDGVENGWPFFTIQLLDGLTLRRIIDLRTEKSERFSLREIEPIFAQIAAGLDAAHEVGPHGNLKPENVIVLPDLLKLTDFGLGFSLPRQPFLAAQRARGALPYFAPEFVAGHEDVDRRIDIYAMGVILGEMLAGVRPKGDNDIPDLRVTAPHLPPAIEALYRRALNENPLSRHATASEFLADLSAIVAEFGGEVESGADGSDAAPTLLDTPAVPPPLPPAATAASIDLSSAKPSVAPRKSANDTKKASGISLLLIVLLGIAIGAPIAWFVFHRNTAQTTLAQQGEASAPTERPSLPPAGDRPATPPAQSVGSGQPSGAMPDQPKAPPSAVAQQPATPTTTAPPSPPKAAQANEPPQQLAEPLKPRSKDPRPEPSATIALPSTPPTTASPQPARATPPATKPEETAQIRSSTSSPVPPQQTQQTPLPKGTKLDDGDFTATASAVKPASVKPSGKPSCPGRQMQLIPAGALRAGTKSDDPMRGFGERAASSITLPAYCIDTYEFPNRKGMMPRGGVSYAVAEAACAKEGKRLCTENEWERACKGAKNQRFPYGEDFEEGACVTKGATGENGSVKISGDSKRCVSSFGVADLSGNLAEWTTSSFNERSSGKVIKGGSADRPDHASRCSARRHGATDKADVGALVGFRCCADPR